MKRTQRNVFLAGLLVLSLSACSSWGGWKNPFGGAASSTPTSSTPTSSTPTSSGTEAAAGTGGAAGTSGTAGTSGSSEKPATNGQQP